jgi:isoquinoline 1-oxidoreductase subunit beta
MKALVDRRQVLSALASNWAAGAWTLSPSAARASSDGPADPWLTLHSDGRVSIQSYVSDLGQGTAAAQRAAVAQQLAVDPEQVQVVMAPLRAAHANPLTRNYATFGSLGASTSVPLLAQAAARMREALRLAAAARWQTDAAACEVRDGAVWNGSRRVALAELAADAARLPLPASAVLRTGPLPRPLDPRAHERVSGRLVYGIDRREPGMLYAAVARAPAFGAAVRGVRNVAAVRAMAGVQGVVPLRDTVAVVASGTWQAQQAARALDIDWAPAEPGADSEALRAALRAAAAAGRGRTITSRREPAFDEARTERALAEAAQTVDLGFDVPYLAHLPMEPLSATVRVGPDGVDLWLSTQSQQDTQAAVAQLLGLAVARVRLHSLPAGGGFGRRLEHDWVLQAVRIARELPGKTVQLLWTRDVELQAGYFRPAAAARVRIALDTSGKVTGLRADLAHPSLLEHTGLVNGPPTDLDWTAGMGWTRQPYGIPAVHVSWTRVDPGVPCAYWRSVGASQNHFFYECALDVAAARSGQSPADLRRRLLAGHPRGLAFLEALLELGEWHRPSARDHFRGMAMASANGSISGHVVELVVTAPGRFRLVRIAAAIDAGLVLDESAVQGQLVGGTVFGLGAALRGGIRIERGRVMADNLADQMPLRPAELPPVVTRVLSGAERIGGVGEEGVPTIAPAIANALFAATGEPVTSLPLQRAGWQLDVA